MQTQKYADATRKGAKNPIDPVLPEGQNRGPSPGFNGAWQRKVQRYR